MKIAFIVFGLIGVTACSAPDVQTANARDNVVRAEDQLKVVKAAAAEDVADAHIAAAAKVDAAAADVTQARAALQAKLDKIDAAIAQIEVDAKTPEQKDEVVKIRARQNTIVVQVRDRDKDGVNWSDIEREVDQAVDDLDRDIETIRIKVVK